MEKIITVHRDLNDTSYGLSLSLANDNSYNVQVPVASVVSRGPADRAGIVKGDVITAINGTPLTRFDEAALRSLMENRRVTSISLSVLSANGSGSPRGLPTMRSCYDMGGGQAPPAGGSSRRSSASAAGNSLAQQRPGGQPSSVGDDEDGECVPRITRKERRYTPERFTAPRSPKVLIKRGYSPSNTSSPDLLATASRHSGSSRSLQLPAKSPALSPMYIREFEEEPIDSRTASPLTAASASASPHGFSTQPRQAKRQPARPPLSPGVPAAPLCDPGDEELLDSSPSPAVATGAVPTFQFSAPADARAPDAKQQAGASTPRVNKLKHVLGESTPVVKNALLSSGRPSDRGQLAHANRRTQSVDALDRPATPGSSPAASSPGKLTPASSLDLESAVFSVTVERLAAAVDSKAGQAGGYTVDAGVRVEKDNTLTVLPVPDEQGSFSVPVGRDCSSLYKKRKLRLQTPDAVLVFRHEDERYLKALQERVIAHASRAPAFGRRQLQPGSPHGRRQPPAMLSSASVDETVSSTSPTAAAAGGSKTFKLGLKKIKASTKLWSSAPKDSKVRSPDTAPGSGKDPLLGGCYSLPLHLCPMGSDGVPLVVQLCCRVLECAGMRKEGIYRVSGNAKNIEALEAELSKDPADMDPGCVLWLEHNVVASVLKRFLLQLPDPLIPAVYYNEFIHTQQMQDHSNRMLKLHRLLSMMEEHEDYPHHKCHRRTLQYIVQHLGRVSQCSAQNRMRVYNLAMVFAPSLFGQRRQDAMLLDSQQSSHLQHLISLTKSIIVYREWLFADWQTADLSVPQEVAEQELDSDAASPDAGGADAGLSEQDFEADRQRVLDAVRDILAAGQPAGAEQLEWQRRPRFQERDIDAEIDKRGATGASEPEPPAAESSDDRHSDSPLPSEEQHRRLLDDVQQMNRTVEQLSLRSQAESSRLQRAKASVCERIRLAEADLQDAEEKRHCRILHSQSSDELSGASRPQSERQSSLLARRSASLNDLDQG